ncbi:MAG: zinc metallopeptidase [Clostridia bacterium]|nr:zinc metallopeptidase [Clostridia bacterium]
METEILTIALWLLGGLIAIVGVVASIWKWILVIRYLSLNRKHNVAGLTGQQVAEELLNKLGLSEVAVKQCGFWRTFGGSGNSYSPRKKTIYLRGNIVNKSSLTAMALAAQQVAVAKQDIEGDKVFKARRKFEVFGLTCAVTFIPIMLLGLLFDFLIENAVGIAFIISCVVAIGFFVCSIIAQHLIIKSESAASKDAAMMLSGFGMVNEAELATVKKVYRTYLTEHIINYILSILELIRLILRILLRVAKAKRK